MWFQGDEALSAAGRPAVPMPRRGPGARDVNNNDREDPFGAEVEPGLSDALAEGSDLQPIVDAFVATLPERLRNMQDALRGASIERLASLTKQLDRSAESCGFRILQTQAASIEAAAHDRVLTDLGAKLEELGELISRIREELEVPDD